MHIINIGTQIHSNQISQVTDVPFFSSITFLDAELIFWDVDSSHKQFPGSPTKKNKIEKVNLDSLQNFMNNRKDEFSEFFKIGRTLIITSPIFRQYEYTIEPSGEKFNLDFIACLNIKKPKISKVSGHNIDSNKEEYATEFLNKTRKFLNYEEKIIKPNGTPMLYIKDTNYVVSEYFKVDNGFIIIMPRLKAELRDSNNSQHFLNSLLLLISELKKNNTPFEHDIPEWVDDYNLTSEKIEIDHLQQLKDRQGKIKLQIIESKAKLSDYRFLKGLFSSDGVTLEKIVEFVFKEMGFETEKPTGNKNDLVIKLNKKIAVVEIKGLTKSAAEKNSAHLQKWVSNYHVENDHNPKGILIINTFKNDFFIHLISSIGVILIDFLVIKKK